MDSELDMQSARALVGDAVLWPLLKAFLWDFAPQVDESWLCDVPGLETLGVGRGSGRPEVSCLLSSPRVKRYILASLGVEPCFHAFPKEGFGRLALLDGAALLSIVKWLGAIVCAESLRSVTKGSDVRALKAALPGIYPEVFGYTAYFTGIKGADASSGVSGAQGEGTSLGDCVVSKGLEIFWRMVSDLPKPLLERVRLKLPKSLGEAASRLEAGDADGGQAASDGRIVKKLLKLKFPEAYRLCC